MTEEEWCIAWTQADNKLRAMTLAAADVVEAWMKANGHHDDIVLERRICDLEELIPTEVLAARRIMRPDEQRSTSAPSPEKA